MGDRDDLYQLWQTRRPINMIISPIPGKILAAAGGRRMPLRLRWTSAAAGFLIGLALAGVLFAPRIMTALRLFPAKKQAPITATTAYGLCRHRVARTGIDPSAVKCLSTLPVGAKYGGWRLTGKSRGLQLTYEIKGLCPSCRRSHFLGTWGGFVAVFTGLPGRGSSLLKMTSIPVESLPRAELEDLQKGIVYRSERERLQILEGLTALENE